MSSSIKCQTFQSLGLVTAFSLTNLGGRRKKLGQGHQGREREAAPMLGPLMKLEGNSPPSSNRESQGQPYTLQLKRGGSGMGGAHLGIWKLYGVLHLKISHCKQERGGAREAEGNDPGEAAPFTALSARARPLLP